MEKKILPTNPNQKMTIIYFIRYIWDKYCYGLDVKDFDDYVWYIYDEDRHLHLRQWENEQ